MVENIINFFMLLDIFRVVWISFWVLIFLGALIGLNSVIFFGFMVWYLMMFPIFKRFDIFMEGPKILLNPNSGMSLFILIICAVFWILLVIKILRNSYTPPKFLENLSKRIVKIWKLPINFFVNVIFFRVTFLQNFVHFCLELIIKHLNTDNKKLIFFSFTIFLPRFIGISAIFYDLHVEKAFIWSPTLGLFFILPIFTKFCFSILEDYCDESLAELHSYIYFEEDEPLTEEEEKIVIEKVGYKTNLRKSRILFKRPIKGNGVENIGVDYFLNGTVKYAQFATWFSKTKKLLEPLNLKILLSFLTIQIIIQIINLCF